jgi:hypothetical protein
MIGESTARYWTDAEITLYIQMAMAKTQSQYFSLLWNQCKTVSDFGVVAATPTYAYPTDAFRVKSFQIKTDGINLVKCDEEDFHTYAEATDPNPVAWMLQGGLVRLLPTPTVTDSDYLLCWYMKNLTISVSTPAVTDFPDVCKSLIGIEAVILARGKDNAITPDLLEIKKIYESAAIMELSTSMAEGQDFVSYDYNEE